MLACLTSLLFVYTIDKLQRRLGLSGNKTHIFTNATFNSNKGSNYLRKSFFPSVDGVGLISNLITLINTVTLNMLTTYVT